MDKVSDNSAASCFLVESALTVVCVVFPVAVEEVAIYEKVSAFTVHQTIVEVADIAVTFLSD